MTTTFNIVGAGHVGCALGRLFAGVPGCVVQDVMTRSAESARRAIAFIGGGRDAGAYAQLRHADVTMLAVGDDQIEAACAALGATGTLVGAVVFHCSGALSSAHLAAARQAGASVASVHPIRSFADPQAVSDHFAGTFCGIEGDAAALAMLEPMLLAIGARPVRIDAAAKTVYHAAAVFASNYLVTVLDTALRAYQTAGMSEDVARQLAQPLVMETVANVFRLGPVQALSGPIARGDMATVARQREALAAWDGDSGALYAALIAPTVALASRKRRI
jgi:predicted short-subunit dehydrogenase-like oxidoreductase (DUF2520 family)